MTDGKGHRTRDLVPAAECLAHWLDQLRDLCPELFSENGIDWDRLREALGAPIDTPPERYALTWNGKREARCAVDAPCRARLVSIDGEGVHADTTQHFFIEGDNLDALKLLCETH